MTPSAGRIVLLGIKVYDSDPLSLRLEPIPAVIIKARFNTGKAAGIKADKNDRYSQDQWYKAELDERCYDVRLYVFGVQPDGPLPAPWIEYNIEFSSELTLHHWTWPPRG